MLTMSITYTYIHDITLHYITLLHYIITLHHYITFTLHYITLHAYIHTYTYIHEIRRRSNETRNTHQDLSRECWLEGYSAPLMLEFFNQDDLVGVTDQSVLHCFCVTSSGHQGERMRVHQISVRRYADLGCRSKPGDLG